jgi:hypothetical protein
LRTAHVGRVHPDLGGEHVDRPLDRCRRLGTARAPVGTGRVGVGEHRPHGRLDLGDLVCAGRHHPGQRGEPAAELGIGAALLRAHDAIGLDGPIPAATDLDVLDLAPAVTHREHVLGAGLVPAHRPADLAGDPREHQLLRMRTDLGAEPAADVGGDHMDL